MAKYSRFSILGCG